MSGATEPPVIALIDRSLYAMSVGLHAAWLADLAAHLTDHGASAPVQRLAEGDLADLQLEVLVAAKPTDDKDKKRARDDRGRQPQSPAASTKLPWVATETKTHTLSKRSIPSLLIEQ